MPVLEPPRWCAPADAEDPKSADLPRMDVARISRPCAAGANRDPAPRFPKSSKLLRHADFQRVYRQGRRHFAAHMTVFYLCRDDDQQAVAGPRVGLTVGRVLGGAVDRNRIKRRLREAVRYNLASLAMAVDVVINPKKSALTAEFTVLQNEVGRAFQVIAEKESRRG
jgi:ribonuclease P protein component